MGLGKLLFGAAVGVGAIAAAPFTGGGSLLAGASLAGSLAGAGTVAAAVGAGVTGAVVGAAANSIDEDERNEDIENAKNIGYEDGRSDGEKETKKKCMKIMKNSKKRDDFLLGLTAFCYAVANCDGNISEEESDELDYFLNYTYENSTLSPSVKKELMKIKEEKPSFNEIETKLDKIEFKDLKRFNEILDNIIEADGTIEYKEKMLKAKWSNYYQKRSDEE